MSSETCECPELVMDLMLYGEHIHVEGRRVDPRLVERVSAVRFGAGPNMGNPHEPDESV